MSQSLQDCPAKLCETRFSATAAWFSWTQAKMFPVLLGSAAPCRFDISFHPRQNLASRPALTRLLLNSLYHITTNTDSYRARWTLVSSENKARCCFAMYSFVWVFCLATQRASVFCHICIHFTLWWKQYHINTLCFYFVYDCSPESSHRVIILWIHAVSIIPAVAGTNQCIHQSLALKYTHTRTLTNL